MPYINRDSEGEISGIFARKQRPDQEFVASAEVKRPPSRVRDEALMSLVHDFGDGRVIQVRPIDEQNINTRIDLMNRHGLAVADFKMLDNQKHQITIDELVTAKESGQDQAAAVWQEYMDQL